MKDIFYACLLLTLFAFLSASCHSPKHVVQKTTPDTPIVVVPVVKQYACGFRMGSFEGKVPCFGNECEESGVPLTSLQFREDETVEKILTGNNSNRSYRGKWVIGEDCIITVHYADINKEEYYLLDAGKLRRLSAARTVYGGALKDQYILQRIN